MVGGGRLKSGSSSSRGGLFGRKKSSAAAAAAAAAATSCSLLPPSSSCPDAVFAEQLHQFDLRLKQLEENQIVRQPRPLPPPAPSSPPPPPLPPPAVLPAPAAPVAAKADVPLRNMTQSCFSAELRRAAEAATVAHCPPRQPQQQVLIRPLERQVPLHGQIRNLQQQQQPQQRSSSSSSSMTSIALREANLRSSLMERLRLLENRIFQLSFELDQEGNGSSSSSKGSSTTTMTTTRQTTAWSSSDKEWPPQSMVSSLTGRGDQAAAEMAIVPSASSSSSRRRSTLGERLRGHILSKMKQSAKDSKQLVQLDGTGRRKAATAGNTYYLKKEKKRMERTHIYKRWFPLIGC